jgi:hypothetical protein
MRHRSGPVVRERRSHDQTLIDPGLVVTLPANTITSLFSFPAGTLPSHTIRNATGNFIISEFGPDNLAEYTPAGARVVLNTTPLIDPVGVAIDTSGDYIVAELGANRLSRVPASGGAPVVVQDFAAFPPVGDGDPITVALDAAGDFIVGLNAPAPGRIVRVPRAGGVPTVIFDYGTAGLTTRPADNLGLDSTGDIITCERDTAPPMGGFLSRITQAGARTVIYAAPNDSLIDQFLVDAQGRFIVPEQTNDLLARVTPAGQRSVFFTFPPGSRPIAPVQ